MKTLAAILLLLCALTTMAQKKTKYHPDSTKSPEGAVEALDPGAPLNTRAVQEPPIFRYVEQMPEAPYDVNAFISKNLRYPEMMDAEDGVRVGVGFVVTETGDITKIELLRPGKVAKPFEEEALRVIAMMPRWKPGKQNGRAVSVYYSMPVTFRKK